MYGGGRAAPLLAVNEPKKTGARSARARTRGQNPLVLQIIYLRAAIQRTIVDSPAFFGDRFGGKDCGLCPKKPPAEEVEDIGGIFV